jgi:hypothetical protein
MVSPFGLRLVTDRNRSISSSRTRSYSAGAINPTGLRPTRLK